MDRNFLKQLELDGDVIDKIMDEHGSSVNSLKDQLATKKDEAKNLKSERDELKTKVGDTQDKEDKINSLQSQYDEAQKQIDDYKAKLSNQSLEKDILQRIPDAYDVNDVLSLIDKSKFEYDDEGNINNMDDVINGFKETKSHLFKGDGATGTQGQDDPQGQQGKDTDPPQPKGTSYRSGSAQGNPKGDTDHAQLGKDLAEKFGSMTQ